MRSNRSADYDVVKIRGIKLRREESGLADWVEK